MHKLTARQDRQLVHFLYSFLLFKYHPDLPSESPCDLEHGRVGWIAFHVLDSGKLANAYAAALGQFAQGQALFDTEHLHAEHLTTCLAASVPEKRTCYARGDEKDGWNFQNFHLQLNLTT